MGHDFLNRFRTLTATGLGTDLFFELSLAHRQAFRETVPEAFDQDASSWGIFDPLLLLVVQNEFIPVADGHTAARRGHVCLDRVVNAGQDVVQRLRLIVEFPEIGSTLHRVIGQLPIRESKQGFDCQVQILPVRWAFVRPWAIGAMRPRPVDVCFQELQLPLRPPRF